MDKIIYLVLFNIFGIAPDKLFAMYRIVLFVLLLLPSSKLLAQEISYVQHYIDSVRPYINENRSTDPRGVFDVLLKVANMDITDGLRLKTYLALATCAMDLGMHSECKFFLERHMKLALKLRDIKAMWYNYSNTGLYFSNIGDYDSAMLYYQKTIRIANDIGMPTTVVKGNIALLYEIIQDPISSIQYFNSALNEGIDSLSMPISKSDVSYRQKYVIILCNTAGNLTKVARKYNDSTSFIYGRKTLEMLLAEYGGDITGLNLLRVYGTMAELAMLNKEYEKAFEYALSKYKLAVKTKNDMHKYFAVDILVRIALNTLGSVVTYSDGLKFADSVGSDLRQQDRINLLLHKSLLYLKSNQIDSAVRYYDKHILLKNLEDEVIDLVKIRIDGVLPYELLERDKSDIEQLKIYSKKAEARFGNPTIYLYITLSIIFILILIGLFYKFKLHRNSN